MKLIAQEAHAATTAGQNTLQIPNDAELQGLNLEGIERIDLQFPKFTDGRAFSQALLLRRRFGFKGEIRATGDVLVDQLVQMVRSGFDAAVLRADQDLVHAQSQFDRFKEFYQGDVVHPQPHFKEAG